MVIFSIIESNYLGSCTLYPYEDHFRKMMLQGKILCLRLYRKSIPQMYDTVFYFFEYELMDEIQNPSILILSSTLLSRSFTNQLRKKIVVVLSLTFVEEFFLPQQSTDPSCIQCGRVAC